MKLPSTPLISRFIETMNAQDSVAFLSCFSPDAIVHDEGHVHRGHAEIRAWVEKAWTAYQPSLSLQEVLATDADTVFTGEVSGSFPGSPIVLRHELTVAEGLITELKIAP